MKVRYGRLVYDVEDRIERVRAILGTVRNMVEHSKRQELRGAYILYAYKFLMSAKKELDLVEKELRQLYEVVERYE